MKGYLNITALAGIFIPVDNVLVATMTKMDPSLNPCSIVYLSSDVRPLW